MGIVDEMDPSTHFVQYPPTKMSSLDHHPFLSYWCFYAWRVNSLKKIAYATLRNSP